MWRAVLSERLFYAYSDHSPDRAGLLFLRLVLILWAYFWRARRDLNPQPSDPKLADMSYCLCRHSTEMPYFLENFAPEDTPEYAAKPCFTAYNAYNLPTILAGERDASPDQGGGGRGCRT
jgi:hypothetical protein